MWYLKIISVDLIQYFWKSPSPGSLRLNPAFTCAC